MSEENAPSKEDRLINDIDFVTRESLDLVGDVSNPDTKARLLQVAQMGNIAKALLISAETVRNGLIWVSDSIDKTVCTNQSTEEDNEEQSSEEDEEEEDEEPDPEEPIQFNPIVPNIRKRYVRTVDGLKLEKAD